MPLAALGSPPGNRSQPEGAQDLCSCSSQSPRLALGITAFLLCGEGAGLSPRQATRSLMTGMEGSPRALSAPLRAARTEQAAVDAQPISRQAPAFAPHWGLC